MHSALQQALCLPAPTWQLAWPSPDVLLVIKKKQRENSWLMLHCVSVSAERKRTVLAVHWEKRPCTNMYERV